MAATIVLFSASIAGGFIADHIKSDRLDKLAWLLLHLALLPFFAALAVIGFVAAMAIRGAQP